MKPIAIAFDFDGTLVQGGLDKGVHLMYAAWVACDGCGLREILRPDNLDRDVERMVRAYLHYPGSPRFQQLSAIVNCLANDRPAAVADPAELGLRPELAAAYPAVRTQYDEVYTALNDIAAERYWVPFPSAKPTLAELAGQYDLYVASGVKEQTLQHDLDRHGFDRSVFLGVRGTDPGGGLDKADLLRRICQKGYEAVLFVGNAVKDLEYALKAGVNFFRVRDDASFGELLACLPEGLPHQPEPWDYGPEEVDFYHVKTRRPLAAYAAGEPMELAAISAWIHE